MAIMGLTHNERGEVVQRLPVAVKVAIGLGPNEKAGRNYPTKLDHFVILRKGMSGKDAVWLPDPELTKLYGEKPTELGVVFMDDEPENVFRTNYAWWTATECRCQGKLVQIVNGGGIPKYEMQATRRTQRNPAGEPWPPKDQPKMPGCGDGCPDLERGDCKPSGDLIFVLDKLPMLGAVCRLHTTSYRSIRQIHAGLQQIRMATGGRLAGMRAMLKVRPEKITYEQDGKKHTTIVHLLSLEMSAVDFEKLIANMTETAKLFEQTRKLLGGQRIEVVEDDDERAPEIHGEFPPDRGSDAEQRALPAAAAGPTAEQLAQQAKVRELCTKLNYNEARANMLLGQNQDDLASLIEKLEAAVKAQAALEVESSTPALPAGQSAAPTAADPTAVAPTTTKGRAAAPPQTKQPASSSAAEKRFTF